MYIVNTMIFLDHPSYNIMAVTTTTAPPVEPACINGKIFETCGTACPLTCDNYLNPPTGCIDECVEGCFCPQGLVQLGDTCVAPTRCPGEFLHNCTINYLYYGETARKWS